MTTSPFFATRKIGAEFKPKGADIVQMNNKLFGRRTIYTDYDYIDASNVVEVLRTALVTHSANQRENDYLYRYYKGEQPVLARTKEYRGEITNKIVENRANEIVSFKVGYLMGEPVQYVSRGDDTVSDEIEKLNSYMYAQDKAAKDKELADWFTVCGSAYRLLLPNTDDDCDEESPFAIYTLDPRCSFIVYYSGLGNRPMMGVKFVSRQDGTTIYSAYTSDMYFEITNTENIIKAEPHYLGTVPMFEYSNNSAKLGAFEIVLPLLDELNNLASNRMDGVEQFIQSILVFLGIEIDTDGIKKLKDSGGLCLPEGADAKYLVQELNQGQTQTLVDSTYDAILSICGMPNRNGGSSTSDTGAAVIMRDGWSDAEARAKDTETLFKKSERRFLKLALKIANIDIKPSSIDIRFTRRNYENIQTKSQVLTSMLNNSKIHPLLAFEHCGMFVDPENAYLLSKNYSEQEEEKTLKLLERDALHSDGENPKDDEAAPDSTVKNTDSEDDTGAA